MRRVTPWVSGDAAGARRWSRSWRPKVAKVMLAYVNSFRDRHGRVRYYFRKGGKRIALPGAPGTAVFSEAYEQELAKSAPHVLVRQGRSRKLTEGTLAWVIDEYKKSPAWKKC